MEKDLKYQQKSNWKSDKNFHKHLNFIVNKNSFEKTLNNYKSLEESNAELKRE